MQGPGHEDGLAPWRPSDPPSCLGLRRDHGIPPAVHEVEIHDGGARPIVLAMDRVSQAQATATIGRPGTGHPGVGSLIGRSPMTVVTLATSKFVTLLRLITNGSLLLMQQYNVAPYGSEGPVCSGRL